MESLSVLSYKSCNLNAIWSDWIDAGSVLSEKDGMSCLQVNYTGKGTVLLQSYIQNEKWTLEAHSGENCGDSTNSKKIQAIRLKLLDARGYHIFYRICFDNQEWSSWKRDYEIAGVVYGDRYITSLEMRVAMEEPHIHYRAHIKNIGWTSMVGDNQIVGYEGKGLRMEALWLHYEGPGDIVIQGHVENLGWISEVGCDTVCGTTAKGLRLEAVRLRLVNLEGYHIYYCSYVKGMGWQPWVKDGETSGTEGKALPIEAVRIRIANSIVY